MGFAANLVAPAPPPLKRFRILAPGPPAVSAGPVRPSGDSVSECNAVGVRGCAVLAGWTGGAMASDETTAANEYCCEKRSISKRPGHIARDT